MFVQNIITLSAAVHELSCWQTFLPYLAMVKKIRKSGPMSLKFSGFRAVIQEHVHAKFHRAKCSAVNELSCVFERK